MKDFTNYSRYLRLEDLVSFIFSQFQEVGDASDLKFMTDQLIKKYPTKYGPSDF